MQAEGLESQQLATDDLDLSIAELGAQVVEQGVTTLIRALYSFPRSGVGTQSYRSSGAGGQRLAMPDDVTLERGSQGG